MNYISSPRLKKTHTQTAYINRQRNIYKIPKICNNFVGGFCAKSLNNPNMNKNDFYCNKCQFTTCSFCYSYKCQFCNQEYIEALNLSLARNY